MRIKRVMAALLAAPLVGLVLGAMPTMSITAQADPNPALHVTSVALNKTSVAVSALNTVPVTVTVKGSYDDASDPKITVYVILERTAGTGQNTALLSTNLPLTGTLQNATWSGPLQVPSTANGTFKVKSVFAGTYNPGSGDMTEPTPYDGPSIVVKGTNIPRLSASVTPKLVPFGQGYSIKWAVTNSATGKPYGSKIRVVLGNDNGCVEFTGARDPRLTDTNGIVTKSYLASDAGYLNCLLLPGDPETIGWLSLFVARPGIVSAAPSKTSAPVGSIVPVNGSVAGAPTACKVNLQRLYGATQWRNVGTANIRSSGRFTANAQPAYRGQIPYRVSFPACYNYAAGLSKVFYIRGL
ncbi:hypothetical protein AB0L70_03385 [Kribbella sp. NPDC051952]|uniref:hypothetical protein n=1 Tax=Kribbella sp. NPDC051952 TaxID=3154851 RepID=UPI00341FB173